MDLVSLSKLITVFGKTIEMLSTELVHILSQTNHLISLLPRMRKSKSNGIYFTVSTSVCCRPRRAVRFLYRIPFS